MADLKISQLDAISALVPAVDVLPVVSGGVTKKITTNQILGSSGVALLASATITGDLTVDTSTLKVDSTNNRVGVNIATPLNNLHVNGEVTLPINNFQYWNAYYSAGFKSVAAGYAGYKGFATNGDFLLASTDTSAAGPTSTLSFYNRYRISNAGIHTWETVGGVAGTAMTLNSTGLGVGGSPTRKLSIVGSGATYANINSGDNTSLVGILLGGTTTPSAGQLIYDNTANSLALFTSGSSRLLIDTSGNVGIGVSTFGTSAAKVLGLANATAPSTSPAGMGQLYVESGALKFRGSSGTITTIAAA